MAWRVLITTALWYRIIIITFCFSGSLEGFIPLAATIVGRAREQDECTRQLSQAIPEPFLLEYVSFESDSYLETEEFYYLVDLQAGKPVSVEQIQKAIFYLFCKNKFETIQVDIIPGQLGATVHFVLTSFWTLAKVSCKGILIGKDIYRQHYLIEPGDPFDIKKHAHSIQKIEDSFKQEGFFNGKVQDHIVYDEPTKTVFVNLALSRGERFSIGQVAVKLKVDSDYNRNDLFKEEISDRLNSQLSGKTYMKGLINKEVSSLKRYLAKKGFLHTSVELHEQLDRTQEAVHLTFDIEIYQKRELVFFGNHFFSHDQLFECIMLFGRSAWLLPASILAQEIVQQYHKKGFWQARVEAKEEKDRYFFVINEGTRAQIKRVVFEGADHFESSWLVKKCFSTVLKTKYFDADLVKDALDQLHTYYVHDGYWDVAIENQDFVPIGNEWYELTIKVAQGAVNQIIKVAVSGCEDVNESLLYNQLEPPPVFTIDEIQRQKKILIDHLTQKGYVSIQVKPEINRDKGSVSVSWSVQADKQHHYFGRTVIVGNQPFPFACLMRELTFKHGEIWDKQQLKNSLGNLKELSVFEHVHLYPCQPHPFAYENPVIVKIQKDDPVEVRMRAGLGLLRTDTQFDFNGVTYKAGGTVIFKNPFDRADLFKADIDFTRFESTFTFQYWMPWFLYAPVRTLLQAYGNRFYYPGIVNGQKNLYEVTQQGVLAGLSRRWLHADSTTNIGIEFMETKISKECFDVLFCTRVARALNFEPRLAGKKIPYFLFEPTIFFDYLDNKLSPTHGSLTLFSFKAMIPLMGLNLRASCIKILAEQSFFTPFRSSVFAFRFRFGHLFHPILSDIMPSERFYLGGAFSLRSYDTDRCPPLGKVTDEDGKVFFVPQGGKSMMNMNLELRFPLFYGIGGVVFQDWGLLTGEPLRNIITSGLLAGTGFGLRYATPIGPLRFDIAWKWHTPDPRISSYAWFVTLGQAF